MTTSVQATPEADDQLTAENLSVQVGDISFTYRRFGDAQTDALPLVMLQHFRGNLDSWDPLLVDGLARDREVVLVNNRGVGGSTGAVPENVTDMARDAIAFIDALGRSSLALGLLIVGAGLRIDELIRPNALMGVTCLLKLVLMPAIAIAIGSNTGKAIRRKGITPFGLCGGCGDRARAAVPNAVRRRRGGRPDASETQSRDGYRDRSRPRRWRLSCLS